MLRRFLVAFLLTLFPTLASASDRQVFDPSGYWTGAIVKNGAVLPIRLDIARDGEGFSAETHFDDWIFYAPSSRDAVELTENGIVVRDLLSGDARLVVEPRYQVLSGTVGEDGRTIYLKRGVPPPRSDVVSTDVTISSGDGTRLAATLSLPRHGAALGGMVMVRGRGCASRVNGRARFLAEYGMAVLTYDKRGAGNSQGDCETFTFDDLVGDAMAAFTHLGAHPRVDDTRVGYFGESAGAWTVQAATERLMAREDAVNPAFIVTWVGPATSILQQQISSAYTFGDSIGLTEERQNVLVEVTRIIADDTLSDDRAYRKLAAIRDRVAAEGWLDTGFGPDDIPRDRADMDGLWLRRFRYDPAPFLQAMGDLPYLSVLGAKDPIVPVEENADALRRANARARVVVLPQAGHGYDHQAQMLTRADRESVWLFEGPDVGFTAETLAFLRELGIASR